MLDFHNILYEFLRIMSVYCVEKLFSDTPLLPQGGTIVIRFFHREIISYVHFHNMVCLLNDGYFYVYQRFRTDKNRINL